MPEKGKKRTGLELKFLIQYQEQVLIPMNWIKQADELIQASKKLEPSIKRYWLTVSKYFDPRKENSLRRTYLQKNNVISPHKHGMANIPMFVQW